MSVSRSARAQISPMARLRIASSISAIRRGISASRAWKNGDVRASRCASSVCLKAGTRATIIDMRRSTPARMRSMSRAFTSRPSIVAASRATPPNSTVVRLVRGAVQTLIESWNGSRRTGSARPWYLMRPWIGWATAVAFIAGPRCPLDVEDDFGDALVRIDRQSMSGHRLDGEPELVALLVDRFPAGAAPQRRPVHVHLERSEQETLRLVDVQEFGEPAQ